MEICLEKDDVNVMMTCELEAAEALAGLSRCSAVRGDASRSGELGRAGQQIVPETEKASSQDQEVAVQNLCGNKSITITSASNTEETVRTVPNQTCSTSFQPNSASKLRHNSTEAEKEKKRLRRVLANRESARQTIRRRQAMHLELTKKATDLLEENENLKKEKEVAVEERNSLKHRNEFLKLKMAKLKKTEPRKVQEEVKSSEAEISTSFSTTSTPMFLYNQSPLVPFIWPNVFQFQHSSRSDIMCSSQIPMQHSDIPTILVPVPFLLPFLSHSNPVNSQSVTSERQNETAPTHPCSTFVVENYHHLSSNQDTRMRARFTVQAENGDQYYVPTEGLEPTRNHEAENTNKRVSQELLEKNKEPNISCHKISEYALAASNARRRRKELLKLKNIGYHHDHALPS